jgi:hypothetical protein
MEQFANEPSAVLSGAINNSVTSITVSGATNIPASGTFRCRIDTEYMSVSAVSGSTWTVTRGNGGTTAASHADSAPIDVIITAEALNALVSVQAGGTEVSNRRVLNFIGATVSDNSGSSRADITIQGEYGITQPPVLSNWTWVNQTNATAVDTTRGIYMENVTPATGHSFNILKKAAPATPYTITAKLKCLWYGNDFQEIGLCFRESSSGKLTTWCFSPDTGGFFLGQFGFTNPTTYGSNNGFYQRVTSDDYYLRIADNGTNRKLSYSRDGEHFIEVFSESRTNFLTADEVGFYIDSGQSNKILAVHLVSWLVG